MLDTQIKRRLSVVLFSCNNLLIRIKAVSHTDSSAVWNKVALIISEDSPLFVPSPLCTF